MSDIMTPADRDERSGRFLSGCKPGPGRQVGSRNRLADAFVQDLAAAWNQFGEVALRRCAEDRFTFETASTRDGKTKASNVRVA
jgi:hypothetical protein